MDDFSGMHSAVRKVEAEKRGGKADPKPAETVAPRRDDNTKVLRSLVDRLVTLEERKRAVQEDIKAVYGDVKATDFNVKAVKVIVKRELETADAKAAREAIEHEIDSLTLALGNFAFTPLGEAAMAQAGAR
jgi:uncharacterized protein (UPF0335 family)